MVAKRVSQEVSLAFILSGVRDVRFSGLQEALRGFFKLIIKLISTCGQSREFVGNPWISIATAGLCDYVC